MLGCPLMIISNQIISRYNGTERILTRNEKIIIVTFVIQILTMIAVTWTVYSGRKTIGTYDIWNTVYFVMLIAIGLTMLLSLFCMAIFGKNDRKKKTA